MFEIDGTAYANRTAYKRCLEKMRSSSVHIIRILKKMHERATDPTYKQLIEEAHQVELKHLAYAHFNIAWLDHPDIMKHYPKDTDETEESEGVENDTCRS